MSEVDTAIADLQRRLAVVEAFLDTELRQRYHLAALTDSVGHAVNPWYGCGLGGHIKPVDSGPIGPNRTLRVAQTPIADVS